MTRQDSVVKRALVRTRLPRLRPDPMTLKRRRRSYARSCVLCLVISATIPWSYLRVKFFQSPNTAIILTVQGTIDSDQLEQAAAKALFSHISHHLYEPVIVYEGRKDDWYSVVSSLVEASRVAEREAYGNSYDLFSGIYGAAVKPAAIRWLAHNSTAKLAWIIEPDVVYCGSWTTLFKKFASSDADLIAFNTTFRYNGNKTRWHHWRHCTFCHYLAHSERQASILPVFRISKRLAMATVAQLSTSITGSAHHECFLPSFVTAHPETFTWIDLKHDVGYMKWRPVLTETTIPTPKVGKLFHPVKSLDLFERLSNCQMSNFSLAGEDAGLARSGGS
jgi:hypothetical protein